MFKHVAHSKQRSIGFLCQVVLQSQTNMLPCKPTCITEKYLMLLTLLTFYGGSVCSSSLQVPEYNVFFSKKQEKILFFFSPCFQLSWLAFQTGNLDLPFFYQLGFLYIYTHQSSTLDPGKQRLSFITMCSLFHTITHFHSSLYIYIHKWKG